MSVTQSDYKRILQSVIDVNDNAVVNVLLTIYDRQTQDEQITEATIEQNGVGFTGADAEILSSFSEQYLNKGYLSMKQMALAREKVKKYWSQIRDVMGEDLSTITANPKTLDQEPEIPKDQLHLWE